MSISTRSARLTFLLGSIIIANSVAWAGAPWIGTWTLNLAKSKFSPGPPPRSQTVTFGLDYDAIKVTIDTVDAHGKSTHSEYRTRFDGKEVPWIGNPNADTATPKVIGTRSYENTSKKDGHVTITARVLISDDRTTLTVVQTGKDVEGRTVNNTAVYDRQ